MFYLYTQSDNVIVFIVNHKRYVQYGIQNWNVIHCLIFFA